MNKIKIEVRDDKNANDIIIDGKVHFHDSQKRLSAFMLAIMLRLAGMNRKAFMDALYAITKLL